MEAVEIREGELVECARCGGPHVVKTFRWDVCVQVITCGHGIQLVGVEHEPVEQRTLVDYSTP
jgi:hypothetical protein